MEDCTTASCLCQEAYAPETLRCTKFQSVKMKSSIQSDLFCRASLEHVSEKNLCLTASSIHYCGCLYHKIILKN